MLGRLPPIPGGGGMGRPLGPTGGRPPGGGGTGLPEGLSGGRVRGRSGADGAAVSGAWATGARAAGAWVTGAWAAGAWAGGTWAGGAGDGAGGGDVGRLLMRRDGRGGASWPPVDGGLAGAANGGADAARAGAFSGGAVLGAVAPDELATALLAGGALLTGVPVSAVGAVVGRGLGLLGRLGRLLGRSGLFGLHRATKTIGVGLAPDAVGLGVLNGRRVALHPNAQGQGQLKPLFVGEA